MRSCAPASFREKRWHLRFVEGLAIVFLLAAVLVSYMRPPVPPTLSHNGKQQIKGIPGRTIRVVPELERKK